MASSRPPSSPGRIPRTDVAIVGAGAAGLMAAHDLAAAGLRVTVFEKARGTGGRLATRREAAGAFDLGAPSLIPRAREVATLVERLEKRGVLQRWRPRSIRIRPDRVPTEVLTDELWVAVPGMSGLTRALADGAELVTGCKIRSVTPMPTGRLKVADERGADQGAYDAVLVAVPAPQATGLLSASPELARAASSVPMDPCWVALAAWDEDPDLGFEAAWLEGSPLAGALAEAGKPVRAPGARWVLHAAPAWSREHVDDEPAAVAEALTAAFRAALDRPLPPPSFSRAHRWLYCRAAPPLGRDHLFDPLLRLGACGDWCLGETVEAALASGQAAARAVLASFGLPPPAR